METKEVITAYCELSGEVANKVFHWHHAADCFCTPHEENWSYQYESHVLDYIRAAVHEKMQRDGKL